MPRRKRSNASDGIASSSVHTAASSSTFFGRPVQQRRRGPRGILPVLQADPPLSQPSLQQCRSYLGPKPDLLDFGDPDQFCPDCHALFWYQERSKSASTAARPVYNLCCRGGRVSLPDMQDPPEPLRTLLDPSAGADSVHFHSAIRMYNSMFAFSSMGVRIDHQINRTPGPYVFRVSGQVCHRIGSLTPPEGQRPAYAQLYFYDTANEIQNRIASLPSDSLANRPREDIVEQLRDMLDQHNVIARGFRTARDRIGSASDDDFRLRISSSRNQHGVQYSTHVADEVVGLVVGDFNENCSRRDIIIHSRGGQLERVDPLHPKYFALQYPLILTRGEDSFTEDIQYDTSAASSSDVQRPHVTMLEYYRYRLHISTDESPTLFKFGKFFQQICVDMYACIEDARLTYLYHNQDSLCMDSVQNIRLAVLEGDMFGYQVVIYTVEFQKRGLPRVHIIVWLVDRTALSSASGIDSIISAELPDPSVDPEGCAIVSRFMMHGPCGSHIPGAASTSSQQPETAQNTVDEIRHYLDCRYLTPPEAVWRIFSFDVHYSYPGVERLPVHLPSHNNIVFSDFQELDEIAESDSFSFTKLIAWFELNKTDELARSLTYIEIPSKFTWKQDEKSWARRQQNRKRLARMLFVHPNAGELHYLRMLLNIVRGPVSFEDIRTVNCVLYGTFKEACNALGLLDNDNEWLYTLQEAAVSASSQQVRKLFVDILLYPEVTDATELWDACWRLMGDDILYNLRSQYRIPQFNFSDAMLKDHILYELEDMLISRRYSLESVKLPQPVEQRLYEANSTLLAQQLSYNIVELREQVPALLNSLNTEQRYVLDQILTSVHNRQGKQFFVYEPGGTGKTHLWSALTAKLRSEGKIVLTVASSGLSSLLLQGGVTAYSRFKIPIKLTEKSTCDIKKNSQLAKLILRTSLIIWDEASMSNRMCFEALDRTMRDLLTSTDPALAHAPFGGITIVLGGDFRQILPVVPRGSRYDTITASIVHSSLYDRFIVLRLTQNMRLMLSRDDPAQAANIADFTAWLLAVGDGCVPALSLDGAAQAEWIKIPDKYLIDHGSDEQQAIINAVYPDLCSLQRYDDYSPTSNTSSKK
ncbi:hypothetical protein LUZ61_004975 [Rhynchospora tenuis]|uniref:ATP-dependent DNA helicase n=1 Tax=Rhynchospora tenuis TaxID=198213 RepID=A0AAD5ZNR3_9POAL|nr:hypothetical protein LUZ61_004975 [Rhynchospora tenuis]